MRLKLFNGGSKYYMVNYNERTISVLLHFTRLHLQMVIIQVGLYLVYKDITP